MRQFLIRLSNASSALCAREYLDHCFFWNQHDLERKHNRSRTHQGVAGDTPEEKANAQTPEPANLHNYTWQSHCDGLFQLPIAA